MARARLRIVTVRDEDILNSEPPDSKSVPVASVPIANAAPDSPKKTAARASKARQSKAVQPKAGQPAAAQFTPAPETKAPATKTSKTNGRESAGVRGAAARSRAAGGSKAASTPKAPAAKPIQVASVMQTNVVTCSVGEALSSVGQAMWDNDVGIVVVVDEQRKPISVVTDRDLAMAAYTQGIALGHIGVGICMSKGLVTCSRDAEAAHVAALMREHRVRRIPVVDGEGQLAGIVGLSDLLKAASAAEASFKPTDVLAVLSGVLS